jgi:hypothetical protein
MKENKITDKKNPYYLRIHETLVTELGTDPKNEDVALKLAQWTGKHKSIYHREEMKMARGMIQAKERQELDILMQDTFWKNWKAVNSFCL